MVTARFDPLQPPAPEVSEKFTLAKGVLAALDRSLHTRRMYQPDHPLYVQNTEEVLQRMVGFFERYTYLRVGVSPGALHIEDMVAVQAPARDPELPFRLHKDGIREIRFHRGLSREELLDFIAILELDSDELHGLGEDYVSLLWSKDFRAIDYVAIDEFESQPGELPTGLDPEVAQTAQRVVARVDAIVTSMQSRALDPEAVALRDGYRATVTETELAFPQTTMGFEDDTGVLSAISPLRRAPEPERPEEPREGPPNPNAQLDAICLTDLAPRMAEMRAEVENETIGGAIRRSIDVLVSMQHDRQPVLEIGSFLRDVVDFHLRKGDFGNVGHLLSHLETSGYLERWPNGRELWDLLVEASRRPDLRRPLLVFLNRMGESDAEGLRRYFRVVGPALVPTAASMYVQIQNPRGRAALCDYLREFGHVFPDLIRQLAVQAEKYLAEIFDVLREVRPPGVPIQVEHYLKHASAELRRQGLTVAGRAEGPARVRQLMGALKDPDRAVRSHAYRVIAETQDPAFRVALQDWMDGREFPGAADERAEALRAYVRVAGAAAFAYLKGVLGRGRAADPRRAAVTALAELGTVEAFEYLKGLAKGGDGALAALAQEALGKAGD